jgi:hypothetical protein
MWQLRFIFESSLELVRQYPNGCSMKVRPPPSANPASTRVGPRVQDVYPRYRLCAH